MAKSIIALMAVLSLVSCATAANNEPNAGHAGGVIRGVARPKKMGDGTHNGGGRANDRKERRANKPKDHRSPRGGDARNSSTSV